MPEFGGRRCREAKNLKNCVFFYSNSQRIKTCILYPKISFLGKLRGQIWGGEEEVPPLLTLKLSFSFLPYPFSKLSSKVEISYTDSVKTLDNLVVGFDFLHPLQPLPGSKKMFLGRPFLFFAIYSTDKFSKVLKCAVLRVSTFQPPCTLLKSKKKWVFNLFFFIFHICATHIFSPN